MNIYSTIKGICYFLIGCLIASCTKENANFTASFTIIQGVPDASKIQVNFQGITIGTPVGFGQIPSTISIGSGSGQLQWKREGQTKIDSTLLVDFANGQRFGIVFYDSIQRYKGVIFKESISNAFVENKAWLRFFPLVTGKGVLMKLANDTNRVIAATRTLGDFAISSSLLDFSQIDTGKTRIKLVINDIAVDSSSKMDLAPGKSYSVYAVGANKAVGINKPRLFVVAH